MKFWGLIAGLLFGSLFLAGCGDDEDDPLSGGLKPKDIVWAQHQYQVSTSGESWGESKWNEYFASIYNKWEFSKGGKGEKVPLIFFSHYRWFPENYGPTYWTEKMDGGDWYYEWRYSSHSFDTKTIDGGKVEMTFDMQGRTWTGILSDGDIMLKTPDGKASVTLTRLPDMPYNGSYDDILKVAHITCIDGTCRDK